MDTNDSRKVAMEAIKRRTYRGTTLALIGADRVEQEVAAVFARQLA
jgi:hypothetical protein